jgi:hypothetical protein
MRAGRKAVFGSGGAPGGAAAQAVTTDSRPATKCSLRMTLKWRGKLRDTMLAPLPALSHSAPRTCYAGPGEPQSS